MNISGFDPAQQSGESFGEWQTRLHTDPAWLRERAAERLHFPTRREWLLERAAAIEAGRVVAPYRAGDGSGVRAV
jgi:hypothetical protein